MDKVYHCAAIDKYITCARDGTFRLWQSADLDYVKTVNNGTSWITDCLYLPYSRKMVFTTMDRAITYYDITRQALLCAWVPRMLQWSESSIHPAWQAACESHTDQALKQCACQLWHPQAVYGCACCCLMLLSQGLV